MAHPSIDNGWDASAAAWIADMGDHGDWGRQFVLDPALLARVDAGRFGTALDVGCGEGRFCRLLAARGIATVGIDPTVAFVEQARRRHPGGDYRVVAAETMDLPDAAFDLVVSCMTLIDIDDIDDVAGAVAQMARVLRPGGRLLIANLSNVATAGSWVGVDPDRRWVVDDALRPRSEWVQWRDIRIRNWHRPLSDYMALLLGQGLVLRHFDEPRPVGGDPDQQARYLRVGWYVVMEWERPIR